METDQTDISGKNILHLQSDQQIHLMKENDIEILEEDVILEKDDTTRRCGF